MIRNCRNDFIVTGLPDGTCLSSCRAGDGPPPPDVSIRQQGPLEPKMEPQNTLSRLTSAPGTKLPSPVGLLAFESHAQTCQWFIPARLNRPGWLRSGVQF